MSQPQGPGPSLYDHPGHLPAKVAVWKRTWVRIAGASLLSFAVGTGVGSTEPAPVAGKPVAAEERLERDRRAQAGIAAALDRAEDEAGRLEDEVSALREREEAAVARVRAEARTDQRKAVRDARAAVRARARAQREKAVSAAVAKARKQTRAEVLAQVRADAAKPAPQAASGGGGTETDPRFSWCYEANDAGYGPYVKGQDPEYDWYQDRDGDGLVCES